MLRQECLGSAPLEHGGRLHAARALFPHAPEPFIDLSTGINPVAYPLQPLPPAAFTRLPEPEDVAALEATAARAYGVADPALVAATPGTQLAIHLLPRLHPARRVAVLGPTYGEHEAAWRLAGAEVDITADPDGLADADVAVLCNPNNPDGRVLPASALLRLAERCALLVVDEAFADFAPAGLSLAGALPHPRLVVLRSFGKAYGLAGVRLGFVLAAAERAAGVRAAMGPWAVSGPAIAIGTAALADAPWRAAEAARLAGEAAALDACIAVLGLHVQGGTTLFRLAEGAAAPVVFTALGEAGILVRRFAARSDQLRFGLPGSPAAWARLRAVAATQDRRQSA
jgi:cobalamin biosynthetic protein CobC